MVDTKTQYLQIKDELDAAIHEVLDSAAYINGKAVQDFAASLASYLGVKHVIPCANGTDALQIAMMALGLEPGDEVIEVDPITFCMDPISLEKAITPKTKAIVPVHLYGQAAPMEEILQIAKKHNLYVIEDNAQAIGCDYTFSDGTVKKTGTMGNIGATSFYPSKNLGAFGDGGALFTNHDIVGCNSRLDSMQAAILNIKLKHLDRYNQARANVATFYNQAFENCAAITTPKTAPYSTHVFHQYTILFDGDRDGLIAHLASKNIPSMIYYPVPGHKQKMFDAFNLPEQFLAITDDLTKRVISFPIHTEMDMEQLTYITEAVLNFINK
jgi:dTDP-4-amino-4,6-dideoxygalactose transaminase